MANILDFPFRYDTTIETYVDFLKLAFIFYTDDEGAVPVDYSGSTFSGEVLNQPGGTKLYDFTFNIPANDGKVWPQLTEAETTALTNRTVHYWVKVTTGTIEEGYFTGELTVSNNFQPGA